VEGWRGVEDRWISRGFTCRVNLLREHLAIDETDESTISDRNSSGDTAAHWVGAR